MCCFASELDCVGCSSNLMELLAFRFPSSEIQGEDKVTGLKTWYPTYSEIKGARKPKEAKASQSEPKEVAL